MAQSQEINMDDYLAMVRRRLKVILVPLVVAPLTGFLISYAFPPKYTSEAMILVEGQKLPSSFVAPVITADFTERIATLQQQILSASRLRPAIQTLGVLKPGDDEGKLLENIRANVQVTPIVTSIEAASSAPGVRKRTLGPGDEPIPGFNMDYSDSDPLRAQKICGALTSLMLDENLRSRAEIVKGTTDFFQRQVDDAKRALDEQDAKLAAFKKQYLGQLPGDADSNLRMLASLNSQLDATTQTLSRAQQDKSYAESMLAQQVAALKASQLATNPQTLEQQLSVLQAQLIQLQSRYTDDHPDVIKTKADIAKVQARLDEVNKQVSSVTETGSTAPTGEETPEIKQLRLQIHQYKEVIEQSTSDQKRLQAQINVYQARTAMSPAIEEQYRELTRDYDTLQNTYRDLLAKKGSAEVAKGMEEEQQGEQMIILSPAGLAKDPSFPVRPILAAGGAAAGLGLGVLLAMWLEFSDRCIRTEKDVAIAMDLPMLISVPWIGPDEVESSNGSNGNKRRFWGRPPGAKDREKVEV